MTRAIRPIGLLALAVCLLAPRPASADVTAFVGYSPKPSLQSFRGFAFGINLLVVGFEIEYANATEKAAKGIPGMTTGSVNGLVQTPTSDTQFYLTAGAGFFRERLGTDASTSVGTNIGGGMKVSLAGPLRLRVDYRVFNLRGSPRTTTPQRLYAGLNLSF